MLCLCAATNLTSTQNNQLVRPGGGMHPGGMYPGGMMGGGVMMPVDNGYGLNDVANLFIQQQVSSFKMVF